MHHRTLTCSTSTPSISLRSILPISFSSQTTRNRRARAATPLTARATAFNQTIHCLYGAHSWHRKSEQTGARDSNPLDSDESIRRQLALFKLSHGGIGDKPLTTRPSTPVCLCFLGRTMSMFQPSRLGWTCARMSALGLVWFDVAYVLMGDYLEIKGDLLMMISSRSTATLEGVSAG